MKIGINLSQVSCISGVNRKKNNSLQTIYIHIFDCTSALTKKFFFRRDKQEINKKRTRKELCSNVFVLKIIIACYNIS